MDNSEKYTYEQILEMLGGYGYYSKATILYVYHSVNGNEEKAEQYLAICTEENRIVIEALNSTLKADNKEE